jgi:signal transduction histidine kinase
VAAVTRTAVANASLELRIEERAREVAASRRRLVEAADGERRALQQTLARGPEQRLRRVSLLLAKAAAAGVAPGGPGLQQEVEAAIAELSELANGVRPAELSGGLRAALPALAARSPLDVSVLVRGGRLPDAVEAAAYFVCSEALANAAKHARAVSAHVDAVVGSDRLRLTISDDGVGGADADGAGLRGLADRVEALSGRLGVESPPGAGTRVLAEIPCNSI